MAINTYLSIITLNVNGLNAIIKIHRVATWLKKYKSLQYAAYKRSIFRAKDTQRLKVRGWKKIFHADANEKKAGVIILSSDEINFKTKATKKNKDTIYTTSTN